MGSHTLTQLEGICKKYFFLFKNFFYGISEYQSKQALIRQLWIPAKNDKISLNVKFIFMSRLQYTHTEVPCI